MQQPGQIRFFGLWILDSFGDLLCYEGTTQGMPPECIGRNHPFFFRDHGVNTKPQQDRPDSFQAKSQNRGVDGFDVTRPE